METDPNSTELSRETRRDIQRLEDAVQRLEIKITRMQILIAILVVILQAIGTYFRIEILTTLTNCLIP